MRFWSSKLRREQVYRRPWLCIYEAHSRAWFGELDQAEHLLDEAEKRMAEVGDPLVPLGLPCWPLGLRQEPRHRDARKPASRHPVLPAGVREPPGEHLSLQFNTRVTLGYEYFLAGDYVKASPILNEAIRAGIGAGALIYTVAAACMVARMLVVQVGWLSRARPTRRRAN